MFAKRRDEFLTFFGMAVKHVKKGLVVETSGSIEEPFRTPGTLVKPGAGSNGGSNVEFVVREGPVAVRSGCEEDFSNAGRCSSPWLNRGNLNGILASCFRLKTERRAEMCSVSVSLPGKSVDCWKNKLARFG